MLPFDVGAALRYGELAGTIKGRRRDVFDRLIAAHALSLTLTLVTNNEADFKGYSGLSIGNWLSGSDPGAR